MREIAKIYIPIAFGEVGRFDDVLRLWGSGMLRWSVVALCALLCGCAKLSDKLLLTPTTDEVSQYATESGVVTVTLTDAAGRPYTRKMYSSEYLAASINYTNQKCDEFFDQLARFNQDSSFVDKVLTAAIAAATPLMAAYGVNANTVAVTAASVAYAENVNKFASEVYAFAPYASQLKKHVKDQMNERLQALGADWTQGKLHDQTCVAGCYNELERLIEVRGRAQQYANLCSIANIRAIIDSSLSNTKSVCTSPPAGGANAPAVVTTCQSVVPAN